MFILPQMLLSHVLPPHTRKAGCYARPSAVLLLFPTDKRHLGRHRGCIGGLLLGPFFLHLGLLFGYGYWICRYPPAQPDRLRKEVAGFLARIVQVVTGTVAATRAPFAVVGIIRMKQVVEVGV